MTSLTREQLDSALATLPLWRLADGRLVRDWRMEDFEQAISFINQVADLATRQGHHPDVDLRATHVRLALISHDAGTVTARDIRLARALDQAFPQQA